MNKLANTLFKLDADYTVDMSVMDNLDYLHKIPDESIHLIVTSPPYNLAVTSFLKADNFSAAIIVLPIAA